MICPACQLPKAGAGAYLPASSTRVCVACFVKQVGRLPLPAGAPSSLGGAFADAKKIAKGIRSEALRDSNKVMNEFSRGLAAKLAGVQVPALPGGLTNEANEAKEIIATKLMGGAGVIQARFNDKAQEITGGLLDQAEAMADQVQDSLENVIDNIKNKAQKKAGNLVSRAQGLMGRFF